MHVRVHGQTGPMGQAVTTSATKQLVGQWEIDVKVTRLTGVCVCARDTVRLFSGVAARPPPTEIKISKSIKKSFSKPEGTTS